MAIVLVFKDTSFLILPPQFATYRKHVSQTVIMLSGYATNSIILS